MALLKELETYLKEFPPSEAATLRAGWDEYSDDTQKKLAAGLMAQSDYSRNIQEATRLKAEAEAAKLKADTLFTSNTEWFRTNNGDLERADQLITENAALKAEIEKAKVASGTPGATTADMTKYDNLIASLSKKSEALEKALKDSQTEVGKRFDAGGMWLLEVENQAEAYRSEFGKPLDRVAFTKFMNEKNIMDPAEAMKVFSSGDRQAKWEVDKEKELRTKIEAETRASQVPYANGTGAMIEKGPLQYYMERPAAGPQTTQAAAVAAAAELAAEGKG